MLASTLQAEGPLSQASLGSSVQGQWSFVPPTQNLGPLQELVAHSLVLLQG